jgi:negative regulator of flagellin synthesis FlgM
MAIDSVTGKINNQPPLKTAPKAESDGVKKPTTASPEKTDSVALTTTTQEIKKAFESSSSQPTVDMDRVAAVKKALADGTYSINAERIAKKMIQLDKQMSQDDSS